MILPDNFPDEPGYSSVYEAGIGTPPTEQEAATAAADVTSEAAETTDRFMVIGEAGSDVYGIYDYKTYTFPSLEDLAALLNADPDNEPSAEVVERAKALFSAAPAPTQGDVARIARLESLLETEHSLKEMYKQREMEAATKAGDLVKAAKELLEATKRTKYLLKLPGIPNWALEDKIDAMDAALAKFEVKQ